MKSVRFGHFNYFLQNYKQWQCHDMPLYSSSNSFQRYERILMISITLRKRRLKQDTPLIKGILVCQRIKLFGRITNINLFKHAYQSIAITYISNENMLEYQKKTI